VIDSAADIFVGHGEATVATKQADVQLRYTTDGSDPAPTSLEAKGTIAFMHTCTIAAQAFRAQRPVSPVARRTFTMVDPLPPAHAPGHKTRRVAFAYYEGEGTSSPTSPP
jgi:hypothetical protein